MTSPTTTLDIAANLQTVRQKISDACTPGRGDGPALVAVSKRQPDDRIDAALAAGHRVFGENRVQEAQQRWTDRRIALPDLKLHLIGPLQTNKAADAVALFDVIESVDRPKLARALAAEMDRQARRLACYIQVNTGEEPQKSGVMPEEADEFIAFCRDECGLVIEGLMCIPPQDEEPAMHFALLGTIAARNGLSGLSMGMSGDYEEAVTFGATSVRVGSAIFGTRGS
ncbi:YggS family pyridoxal phosphate-dependent enzyme [Alphaproteobacteria bacterium LSUCC0719]